jgi:hypothetical protein
MKKLLGFTFLIMGAATSCLAGPPGTPEIDPTSAGAAIALLAGGLLVIQYRRKK